MSLFPPLQALLGREIEDPEEEAFLLFSQSIPSQNLGFVDATATQLELSIHHRHLAIHQSPTILSSDRGGGTTGAVVWKITPLFASWVTTPSNFLFKHDILGKGATVLELGCGISGIIGLVLAPLVANCILTDQDYVMKLLRRNIAENRGNVSSAANKGRKSAPKPKRGGSAKAGESQVASNLSATSLDWETDQVTSVLAGSEDGTGFDAVIACDCIYNDALIQPLVQTCVDACKLRLGGALEKGKPTVCIVAQQLRSAEVFEGWLMEFFKAFHAWRVPDEELIDGLRSNSGFVIHIGILR